MTMMTNFPELTAAENAMIDKARAAGFAAYFPAFPSAEDQAISTVLAAEEYLKRHHADQSRYVDQLPERDFYGA